MMIVHLIVGRVWLVWRMTFTIVLQTNTTKPNQTNRKPYIVHLMDAVIAYVMG